MDDIWAVPRRKRYLFRDRFARPDSATSLGSAASGQAWQALSGTWGISGGKGYLAVSGADRVATVSGVVVVAATGYSASVMIERNSAPSGNWGLVFGAQDSTHYYIAMYECSSSAVSLYARSGGSWPKVGASAPVGWALNEAHTLGVRHKGTSIQVLVDGMPIVTATDATYSSGGVGLCSHNSTGVRFVSVEARPVGGDAVAVENRLVFACFKSTDRTLYLLQGAYPTLWTQVGGGSLYTSPTGWFGDPSLVKVGATYWIAHTLGGGVTTTFGVISSPDLLNWTHVADVDCSGLAGCDHTWAPDWFVDDDGSVHVFVALSTSGSGGPFQIYEVHPTNAGYTAWSAPVAVTGATLPANMIDAHMVKVSSTYRLVYKNETTKYVEYATSTSLTSGYTVVGSGDWAGWGGNLEGPSIVRVGSRWGIYLDKYVGTGMYYSESADDWSTWSPKVLISDPFVPSHGCVVPL